jgi:hypothetical protein
MRVWRGTMFINGLHGEKLWLGVKTKHPAETKIRSGGEVVAGGDKVVAGGIFITDVRGGVCPLG